MNIKLPRIIMMFFSMMLVSSLMATEYSKSYDITMDTSHFLRFDVLGYTDAYVRVIDNSSSQEVAHIKFYSYLNNSGYFWSWVDEDGLGSGVSLLSQADTDVSISVPAGDYRIEFYAGAPLKYYSTQFSDHAWAIFGEPYYGDAGINYWIEEFP